MPRKAKTAGARPALQAAADVLAAARALRADRADRADLAAAPAAPPAETPSPPAEGRQLTAADRENPDKLSGDALRQLAHRRGIARSEAARMDDAKLRMQLRYLTSRQYADEEA